jgi:hypothetical protein
LNKILTLAVSLKTFDFGFFQELCSEDVYNIISYKYFSPAEVREHLKKLYSLDVENLNEFDKLALLFFVKLHDADCEKDILKNLASTDDSEYIYFYTGKKTLSSKQRKKILSEGFSLKKLFVEGI